jgi:hypothetical protein
MGDIISPLERRLEDIVCFDDGPNGLEGRRVFKLEVNPVLRK